MNKGLKALKKASPEAFAKIMGKMAMDGMKTPYGDNGLLFGKREKVRDEEGRVVGKVRNNSKLRKFLSGSDAKAEFQDGGKMYAYGGMNVVKDYGMGGKMYEEGGGLPFGAASSGAAAGDSYRGLTTKDLLAVLTGASSSGAAARAGALAEEENLTDEERVARLASVLRASGSLSPETVNDIREAEGSDAMGYTTAVDNTAAPFLINPPVMTAGSMNRNMEPMEDMRPPQGISPMEPLDAGPLPLDMKMRLLKSDRIETPDLGNREDAGFITAPYLKTGQVPTNIRFRDPKTRQMKQRQMEPEEIANFIFENQNPSARKFDRDQAYQRALEIMRGRS